MMNPNQNNPYGQSNQQQNQLFPITSSVNSLANTFNDSITEILKEVETIKRNYSSLHLQISMIQLKLCGKIDDVQMISLIRQLNSADPEAIQLALVCIHKLMKEI